MNNKIGLYTPIFYVLIAICVVLVVITSFFDTVLFYICSGIVLIGIIYVFIAASSISRQVDKFLTKMGSALEQTQKDSIMKVPVPVFVVRENNEVIWYNEPARETVLGGVNKYGADISVFVPDIDIKMPSPPEGYNVKYEDKLFTVYTTQTKRNSENLYVVYMFEDTQLKEYAHEYLETRQSIAIIMIDNYEELLKSARDNERSQIMIEVEGAVENYTSLYTGFVRRIERDKFIAIFEERHMRTIVEHRFDILDKVREIIAMDRMPATLSIGVGRGGKTLYESEQMAKQALDMALGRGGDQAAVKNPNGYEFYGGISKGVEKRTKVKTRIIAAAMVELIASSDNVIVMGHRFADLDCFASGVALVKAVRSMGKPSVVAINRAKALVEPLYVKLLTEGYTDEFMEPEAALQMVNKKTLLIVVDTHIPYILESQDIYKACKNIIVIDHHRKMVNHIDNAVIFYHEPYASSTAEMITELVQYFSDRPIITRVEAEALLSGIMLDTKNFILKTGVRTFEAAAYLRRLGADTVEVKKLFSSTMESYQRKTKLVASAEIYRSCAIAQADVASDVKIVAPQAADDLLGISGVDASCVMYEENGGVSFSARSMGLMNVQLIMEKLGGGGHLTMAGSQIKEIGLIEAKQRLFKAIDEYYEQRNIN